MIASGLRTFPRPVSFHLSNTRRQILYPLVGKLGAAVPGWIGSHQFFFLLCIIASVVCARLDDTCGFPHYEGKRGDQRIFLFIFPFIRPSHHFPCFVILSPRPLEWNWAVCYRFEGVPMPRARRNPSHPVENQFQRNVIQGALILKGPTNWIMNF